MESGGSENLDLSELCPGLSYEEALEVQQAILCQFLGSGSSSRPASRIEESSSHDPLSTVDDTDQEFYYDLDYNEAIARSLQDELDHLSISEPVQSESERPRSRSATSLAITDSNQPDIDVDRMSYEELNSLGDTIGRESKGLSSDEIATLQPFKYRGGKKLRFFGKKSKSRVGDNTADCRICFLEFENGTKVVALPRCLHQYHRDCITRWLEDNKICPICREEVKP